MDLQARTAGARPIAPRDAHVLVVGAYSPLLDRLWAAGASTSWVCDPSAVEDNRGAGEHESVTVVGDGSVAGRVALAVQTGRALGVTHVVALDDASMLVAALAREALGVGGGEPSSVVRRVHDKAEFREALAAAAAVDPDAWRGVAIVRHARVRAPQDVLDFGETHGWPIVLKPASGTGSAGVTLGVTSTSALHAYADARRWCSPEADLLVEEQLDAPMVFTVDTLSHDGRHHVTAFGYELFAMPYPHVSVSGVPAPIEADQESAVVALVQRALTALGVSRGPAHTEVLVRSDGTAALIESQLRPGGELPEMTRAARDFDPFELWARQILGADPGPTIASAGPYPRSCAMIYATADQDGSLVEALGVEAARRLPGVEYVGVVVAPGSRTARVRRSSMAPIVVLTVGVDPEQALQRCLATLRPLRLRIRLDPPVPSVPAAGAGTATETAQVPSTVG